MGFNQGFFLTWVWLKGEKLFGIFNRWQQFEWAGLTSPLTPNYDVRDYHHFLYRDGLNIRFLIWFPEHTDFVKATGGECG